MTTKFFHNVLSDPHDPPPPPPATPFPFEKGDWTNYGVVITFMFQCGKDAVIRQKSSHFFFDVTLITNVMANFLKCVGHLQ